MKGFFCTTRQLFISRYQSTSCTSSKSEKKKKGPTVLAWVFPPGTKRRRLKPPRNPREKIPFAEFATWCCPTRPSLSIKCVLLFFSCKVLRLLLSERFQKGEFLFSALTEFVLSYRLWIKSWQGIERTRMSPGIYSLQNLKHFFG